MAWAQGAAWMLPRLPIGTCASSCLSPFLLTIPVPHGNYRAPPHAKIYLFTCFWQLWVLVAVQSLSLVEASRDYSLAMAHGLLIAVASLVLEHRLQWLQRVTSVVAAHRSSCHVACRLFPDQGLNLCPLHCKADS